MAFRRAIAKRLFSKYGDSSPVIGLQHSPFSTPSTNKSIITPNAAKTNFHRELLTLPDEKRGGFFRRLLQQRGINQAAELPGFLSIPVGEKLREKLSSINLAGNRLRLDGLSRPAPPTEESFGGISVYDAKKILRSSQLEMLRSRLKRIPMNSISHGEFVQICVDVCSDREQGLEFAKTLDQSGNVIVLGNIVFLQPDQVAKSMEKMIYQSVGMPNDPRRKELEKLEKQKAAIDQKAQSLVRGELYCGLGFFVLQTLGFMRLTFWELSWDVMEPICFFFTSIHFAFAYTFFLRTSKDPSFESYFQRRFNAKQKRLMKIHNFDIEKYDKLCRVFYPNYCRHENTGDFSESYHQGGTVFRTMRS